MEDLRVVEYDEEWDFVVVVWPKLLAAADRE